MLALFPALLGVTCVTRGRTYVTVSSSTFTTSDTFKSSSCAENPNEPEKKMPGISNDIIAVRVAEDQKVGMCCGFGVLRLGILSISN